MRVRLLSLVLLLLVATSAQGAQVKLAWDWNPQPQPGQPPPATPEKFNVYVKAAGQTNFIKIGETTAPATASQPFVWSGAQMGITYVFVVRSWKQDAGESENSNEATVAMMQVVMVAPTNLVVVGTSMSTMETGATLQRVEPGKAADQPSFVHPGLPPPQRPQ